MLRILQNMWVSNLKTVSSIYCGLFALKMCGLIYNYYFWYYFYYYCCITDRWIFRHASIHITCKKVHENLKASNALEINHYLTEAMQHQYQQYLHIKQYRTIISCIKMNPCRMTFLVTGDKEMMTSTVLSIMSFKIKRQQHWFRQSCHQ